MSAIPAYIRVAEQIKAEWLSDADSGSGKKLPTQEELAERFGVSRSTIVRTLSKLVAEGYIHSQQGSGVYVAESQPRVPVVARLSLIVPALHAPVIMASCRGVERRARQLGYQVLLASSEGNVSHERELVEQHLQAGVKGIVLCPVTRRKQEVADDYLTHWSHETPVVAMDIACEEWPCARAQFDNYRLSYDMTKELLRRGHRHIAFMHTWTDFLHSSIHDRKKGWKTAMAEAGADIPPSYAEWPVSALNMGYKVPLSDADFEAIAESLLNLRPRPDAVIAWEDSVAAHLTQALLKRGICVPEEIRLTGFDCEPTISRLFRPLFPTSKPDFARLGELAVEALTRALAQETARPCAYYYPVPVLWREPRSSAASEPSNVSWGDAVVEA